MQRPAERNAFEPHLRQEGQSELTSKIACPKAPPLIIKLVMGLLTHRASGTRSPCISSLTPTCGGVEVALVLLDTGMDGAALLLRLFVLDTSVLEALADLGASPTSLLRFNPVLD